MPKIDKYNKACHLSIIIPTYNRKNSIMNAVRSVGITDNRCEILIIDDGSDDGTEKLFDIENNHKGTRYFRVRNGGPSKARNFGVEKANGNFVCFLDSDDLFLPNATNNIFKIIAEVSDFGVLFQNNYRVSESDKQIIKEDGYWERSGVWRFLEEGGGLEKTIGENLWIDHNSYANLLIYNYPVMNGTTIRKDVFTDLGGFNENYDMGEDHDLWIRISKTNKVLLNKQPSSIYIKRKGSMTDRREIYLKAKIYVPQSNYEAALLNANQRENFVGRQMIAYNEMCYYYLENGELKKCIDLNKECVSKYGFSLKSLRIYVACILPANLKKMIRYLLRFLQALVI